MYHFMIMPLFTSRLYHGMFLFFLYFFFIFSGYRFLVFVKMRVWFGFMVFNATFNNISVIPWRSVLLVEETGGPGENHRPAASHWQTLSHNVVHLALSGSRIHNIKIRGIYFNFTFLFIDDLHTRFQSVLFYLRDLA